MGKEAKKIASNHHKIGKELIKTHKYQAIIVTGSRWFELLELLGVWLHIFALAFGILALAGIVVDSNLTHALEIATLIVVALIIIQHAVMPIASRVLVRRLLKGFWGINDIPTTVSYPKDIDVSDNFGKVKSSIDSWQIEKTEIKWTVTRWVPFKKVLTVQQTSPITQRIYKKYGADDGNLHTAFLPLYIIIDVKNETIKFQGRTHILDAKYDKIPEKRTTFTFHYKQKVANWSGIFPEHPLYGEWLWDPARAKTIIDLDAKAKAQAKKKKAVKKVNKQTSKAVKEEFKNSK